MYFVLLQHFIYAFFAFQVFWHVTQFRNARKHKPRLYIFLIFTSDHKQVVAVNFKGVADLYIKTSRREKVLQFHSI